MNNSTPSDPLDDTGEQNHPSKHDELPEKYRNEECPSYIPAAEPAFLYHQLMLSRPEMWELSEGIVAVSGFQWGDSGRTVELNDETIAKKFPGQRTQREEMRYRAVRAIQSGRLQAITIEAGNTRYYVCPAVFLKWCEDEGFGVPSYLREAFNGSTTPRFELRIADCARELMELHPSILSLKTAERIVRNHFKKNGPHVQPGKIGERTVPFIEVGEWKRFKATYQYKPRRPRDFDDEQDDDLPENF